MPQAEYIGVKDIEGPFILIENNFDNSQFNQILINNFDGAMNAVRLSLRSVSSRSKSTALITPTPSFRPFRLNPHGN